MTTNQHHPALAGILERLALADHPAILSAEAGTDRVVSLNPTDGRPLAAVGLALAMLGAAVAAHRLTPVAAPEAPADLAQ